MMMIFALAGCHERRVAGLGTPAGSDSNRAGAAPPGVAPSSAVLSSARVAGAGAATAPSSAAASSASTGTATAAAVSSPEESGSGALGASKASPAMACHEGFSPSGVPRIDVLRLGMACGPISGLTEIAKTSGTLEEAGRKPTLGWDALRGDCFRLFAVATEPVEDIDVEIDFASTPKETIAHVDPSRRWAVVGEDGPLCATRTGHFEAFFTTHAGSGEIAAAVWRGARMLQRRP